MLSPEQIAAGIIQVAKDQKASGDFGEDVQRELMDMAKELKDSVLRSKVTDALEAIARGEEPDDLTPTLAMKGEQDPVDPIEQAQPAIPRLAAHDMDTPAEPEEVDVITTEWDEATSSWKTVSLGKMLLVPTGCEQPIYANPYESSVGTISALPRDKQAEANLYSLYQKQGWASRDWIRDRLQENINPRQEDERIEDDIPFLNLLNGKPADGGAAPGVGQTPGMTGGAGADAAPGNNNGAPLPPGPGPGRGNKYSPGDNLG